MFGYSGDGENSIDDDRIFVLDKNLKKQNIIKTSKGPNLICGNNNYIYATIGERDISIDKIDVSNGKVVNSYQLNDFGTPLSSKFINDKMYIFDSVNLYSIDSSGSEKKSALKGETLSVW